VCARAGVARTRNRASATAAPSITYLRSAGGPGPGGSLPKTDSGHIGTISITVRACRARRNAMKPQIQCALTQWIPGFIAFWCFTVRGLVVLVGPGGLP